MVLLEMSITPLGVGDSVSHYVAECVDLVDQSGLDYELHAMGTIVEGELDQVLDLMRRCIEQVAKQSDRVTRPPSSTTAAAKAAASTAKWRALSKSSAVLCRKSSKSDKT